MHSSAPLIEWEITPPDWIVLRALVYGTFAIFYGFFLFVLGAAVAFVTNTGGARAGLVVVVATGAVVVILASVLLYTIGEPTRNRVGRYLSIAGSQSGSVFDHWKPWTLTGLAFVGFVCQALLWTTGRIPLALLVGVPIIVRLVEEVVVAVVPLAGTIDWSTDTYVRRLNGPPEPTDEIEFDLEERTLHSEWPIGEVTVRCYTGEGPPLSIPVPNEYRGALETGDDRTTDGLTGNR